MSTELPPSAIALAEVLKEDGDAAKLIRKQFHRTAIWRWLNAKRPPDLESATFMDRATEGRVPASGWVDPKEKEPTAEDAA